MNRAEKRKQIAIAKKKAEFAKKLTPVQQQYINEVVELTKQNTMLLMADILDTAMTGALVEDTALTMQEIFNINMKVGQFIAEIQRKNIEIGVEERKMNLKKIEAEGIKEIEKLIGEGKRRAEIVKAIREKYKGTGITTAEINSAYKQVNERLEKEAAAKKAIEILEEADKKTEVVNNSSKVEEVEADHEEEFEIINRCIELKGKFGTYKIENRVMTVNEELAFTDVEEIKDWANLEREELLKKIAIITAKEEEAIKAINRYM
ncbi:hypothetical protein [Clostridium sp.]|uniref:hypothetical protein n=1 Tax=Clostridium sp. TaxID=1506 RepID=UPI003990CCCD